jgi:hypothetical protein
MLRRLMDWQPKDLSGGDDPMKSTYENHLNFVAAYRLVDVLSFHDGRSPSPRAPLVPKDPKLPVLARGLGGKQVRPCTPLEWTLKSLIRHPHKVDRYVQSPKVFRRSIASH